LDFNRRWTSQRVGRLCRLEATGVQMDADNFFNFIYVRPR